MPQLIIEQPGVAAMTLPLDKQDTLFGRSDDCDVVLVADEVSRNHARIVYKNNRCVLIDLKSMNGTYVNRLRVVERVLSHLDELFFGSKCRLVFRDDTQSGPNKTQQALSGSDSQIIQNMDKIREEMERVGNSMTMIGRNTPTPDHSDTKTPPVTEIDLIKMSQAYRRLEALYKAGNVMVGQFDLEERLRDVLDMVLEVMDADRGFVMLREKSSQNLVVTVARSMGQDLEASSPSMGIAGRAAIDGESVLMTSNIENQEFGMRQSIIQHKITSAMCVPLKVKERVLGSIYIDTHKGHVSFGDEELELFSALGAQAAMAIDNVQLHDQVVEAEKKRQDFGRFLSPDIVEKIIDGGADLELGGQKTMATTLFCDIRGFTSLSEKLTPKEVVDLLNDHFTAITEIIFEHKGSVNKFIGDEVMAVFGAPFSSGTDEFNAVKAALAIQEKNIELNALRLHEGLHSFDVGIGIDTGYVSAGYVGSPMRMEYTVIGDRVNTASRFCSMAQAGQVIAGHSTWEKVSELCDSKPIGTVMLKGKAQPVHAHEITRVR